MQECPRIQPAFPQNESETDFLKIFSTSDFLRHFDIIRDEHEDFLEPWAIKIKCKAIKKFIAYDGFYPSRKNFTNGYSIFFFIR